MDSKRTEMRELHFLVAQTTCPLVRHANHVTTVSRWLSRETVLFAPHIHIHHHPQPYPGSCSLDLIINIHFWIGNETSDCPPLSLTWLIFAKNLSLGSTTNMKATRALCRGTMKSPLATLLGTLLLLGASPQQQAIAAENVCHPTCEPFGKCDDCGIGDNCSGQFCRCTAGYEGADCSIKVEYCPKTDAPGSVPLCRNGGHCVSKEIMQDPEGFGNAQEVWRCDCTTAIGSAASPMQHAGAQCEFQATQSCLIGGIDSNYAFCVNGGDCVRKIARGDEHPGCVNCPGFEGRHCQYREGEAPVAELKAARKDVEDEENGIKPGLVVVLVLLACVALGVLAICIVQRATERNQDTQAAVDHASTDVPNDLKLDEGQAEKTQQTAHDSEEDEEEKIV